MSQYALNKNGSCLEHCQYFVCVESGLPDQDLDERVLPDGSGGVATVVCDY